MIGKLIVPASIVITAGLLYLAVVHKADQGYVRATNGTEWELTRMQTLGLEGEYVAVYRKK